MGKQGLPLRKALLGFLMQGPMHGYDLHQRVERELGYVWHLGIGNIYNTLQRLEQEGQVKSDLQMQENRPPRKVYRITAAGKARFLDWVRQPVPAIRDMRVEFPVKLYFFRLLRLDGVGDLLTAQEDACRRHLKRLEQRMARYAPSPVNRLVFEFRRSQIEAALRWLKTCREEWTGEPSAGPEEGEKTAGGKQEGDR